MLEIVTLCHTCIYLSLTVDPIHTLIDMTVCYLDLQELTALVV
jgi:hypothetical protein